MELIAAIDLLGGHAVRLRRGDYGDRVGEADPIELAARWTTDGIRRFHVVDLEGARAGESRQLAVMAKVFLAARASAPGVGLQAGGGLRTQASVAAVLEAGADAAVLGTAALERPGFLAGSARRWPGRILAALDLRDGRLAVDGWLRTGDADPAEAAARLLSEGAAGLLVTDTRRDGALVGPNLSLFTAFRDAFPGAWLVAAGGIRSTDDLVELQRMGLDAAIVGMALLTEALDVSETLAALATPAVMG